MNTQTSTTMLPPTDVERTTSGRWLIVKISGKPNSSIASGYWVKGCSLGPPVVGESFVLDSPIETSENERFDWFTTTEVKSIDQTGIHRAEFTTKNSVWSVQAI